MFEGAGGGERDGGGDRKREGRCTVHDDGVVDRSALVLLSCESRSHHQIGAVPLSFTRLLPAD